MTTHELAIKIIEKFGRNAQMLIVVEELVELQKEVLKCLRPKPNIKHLTEELADVEICLEQLKVMYPEIVKDLPRITQEKIDRTEERYLKGENKEPLFKIGDHVRFWLKKEKKELMLEGIIVKMFSDEKFCHISTGLEFPFMVDLDCIEIIENISKGKKE